MLTIVKTFAQAATQIEQMNMMKESAIFYLIILLAD